MTDSSEERARITDMLQSLVTGLRTAPREISAGHFCRVLAAERALSRAPDYHAGDFDRRLFAYQIYAQWLMDHKRAREACRLARVVAQFAQTMVEPNLLGSIIRAVGASITAARLLKQSSRDAEAKEMLTEALALIQDGWFGSHPELHNYHAAALYLSAMIVSLDSSPESRAAALIKSLDLLLQLAASDAKPDADDFERVADALESLAQSGGDAGLMELSRQKRDRFSALTESTHPDRPLV